MGNQTLTKALLRCGFLFICASSVFPFSSRRSKCCTPFSDSVRKTYQSRPTGFGPFAVPLNQPPKNGSPQNEASHTQAAPTTGGLRGGQGEAVRHAAVGEENGLRPKTFPKTRGLRAVETPGPFRLHATHGWVCCCLFVLFACLVLLGFALPCLAFTGESPKGTLGERFTAEGRPRSCMSHA